MKTIIPDQETETIEDIEKEETHCGISMTHYYCGKPRTSSFGPIRSVEKLYELVSCHICLVHARERILWINSLK